MKGTCIKCGCTDANCSQCIEKTGDPCFWVDQTEELCSACHATEPISLTSVYDQDGDLVNRYTNITIWGNGTKTTVMLSTSDLDYCILKEMEFPEYTLAR